MLSDLPEILLSG